MISVSPKMELFVSLVNGFSSFLTNARNNILDVGFHRFRLHFRFLDIALKHVYK